jgi:Protein of unknown function (DUF3500)
MRARIALAVIALGTFSVASAQDDATETVRAAMFAAANEVYQSISRGGGFVTNGFGIDRGELMQFPLDDAERENWQFWPTTRVGLPIEYMTASERRATHDLLASALSSQGYLKAVQIMQLEQVLDMLDEGGFPRSVDHYVLAVFGVPSMSEPWAWRFEGHHVSLNVAVAPDGVAVTPSFFGSNPAQVRSGPLAGLRVHGRVEDLARELVGSLSGSQREQAVVGDRAPGEIATANMNKPPEEWEVWRNTLEPIGIPVRELNEIQQYWVGLIVDEVIGNYEPGIQKGYREALDLESLSFGWMGATERGQPHYFRVQGPSFLFEYDNVQNGGNHVHSVWRNSADDFGRSLLARHYDAAH